MSFLVKTSLHPKYAVGSELNKTISDEMELASLRYGRLPKHLVSAIPTILRVGAAIDGKPASHPRPIIETQVGWIVPKAFVAAVESLESGIHAVWPLRVESLDASGSIDPLFLIEPGPRIDAVIPERSNVTAVPEKTVTDDKGNAYSIPVHYQIDIFRFKLCIDRAKVEGRHFWFAGPRFGFNSVFFSNELADWVQKEGVFPPDFLELRECEDV